MPIRFAAPATSMPARMTRDRVRAAHRMPANDNGDMVDPAHMHAALRHFAKHGLAAAQHAREQAIIAARAGDRPTFEWWLEICRALDRRMARKLDRSHACAGETAI
ncbi:hypothetical protein [Aurantiacibacter sp. MUD61]|uniref:hypothetical protein n=1 Tax=Aurantiacibacter sp. MUD61 TaxID=3009083 RepID=UPI0022F04E28|nr:hypothetical protein [Aurantiacibacter sp. MUD61]